jgi:hypothetical protein
MNLPIRDTIFEVFHFQWENRTDLLRMSAAPVFALSIFHIILPSLFAGYTPTEGKPDLSGMNILGLFLAIALPTIFYVMFAVAWHRRCLKSEEQTTILTALRWEKRKTLFLFRFIQISILSVIAVLPVLVIGSIVGFFTGAGMAASGVSGPSASVLEQLVKLAIIIVVMLVQVRLSLILPATALDQKLTLMEAWVMGRENTWRLFAILMMAVAPAMVILILIGSALTGIAQASGLGDTLTFQFVVRLIYNMAYYVVIATSVSALSISYRKLRQTPNPGMPYQM